MVAHDRVVASRCIDHIRTTAAENDIAAGLAKDLIVAIATRRAVGDQQRKTSREGNGALVADDNIGTGAGVNDVARIATENEIVVVTCRDGVAAAHTLIHGGGHSDPCAIPSDHAVVTKDKIVAIAGTNGVVAIAAEHGIGTVIGLDEIACTRAGRRCSCTHRKTACKNERAGIAEHHVVASTTCDIIGSRTTENHVSIATGDDSISAANRLRAGGDSDGTGSRFPRNVTMITQHHIAALLAE